MIQTPQQLFAYLGPETTLPLVSMLGTVVGILLIFWQFLVRFVKRLFRTVLKKGPGATPSAPVVPSAETTVTVRNNAPDEMTA